MELIGAHSLEDFFHDRLAEALQATGLEIGDGSQTYLIHLFDDFSRVDALHRRSPEDDVGAPTLVWLYEQAQLGAPSERFDAWRHLGDVALMVAGLFGAHLERRRSLVGVDYYVRMGAGAYGSAATYHRGGFGPILEELAAKFRRLVDVLARIGEAVRLPVASRLESLYDRWLSAPGQEDLHARLTRMGAAPVLLGTGSA